MAIYYVDQSHRAASDSNAGSESSPWLTIQHAADQARPGDTIYVKAGTYDPFEIVSSGTEGNHIVFSAYPGDEFEAIIDGTGENVRGLIEARGQSHLTITGFRLQNAPIDGIFVEGSAQGAGDILISGNQVDTTGNSGIYAAGLIMGRTIGVNEYRLFDIIIENNEVTNTNYPNGGNEAISVGGGLDGFIIRNNWVHDSEQYGIDAKFGAINGEIYGNLIHDIEKHGIYLDTNSRTIENVKIYNNTIYNSNNGIVLARESARDPAVPNMQNIDIYDNLIYNNTKYGIMAYKHIRDNGTGLFDDVVINSNTVYGNGRDGIHLVGIEDFATNFVVSNNAVFANGDSNILNRIGAAEFGNNVSSNYLAISAEDGADANTFEPDLPGAGDGTTLPPAPEPDVTQDPDPTSTPNPTPTPSSGFILFDAVADQALVALEPGGTLSAAYVGDENLTIAYEATRSDVGSVKLDFNDGQWVATENNIPYALFSDNYGDYFTSKIGAIFPTNGAYSIDVTLYSGRNGTGDVLGTETVSFVVGGTAYEPEPDLPGPDEPTLPPEPDVTPAPEPEVTPRNGFILFDAVTDQALVTLASGGTLGDAYIGNESLTIAYTAPRSDVGSVRLNFNDGQWIQTENASPYALFGDKRGDYFTTKIGAIFPTSGTYSIDVTLYSGRNGTGDALGTETVSFVVGDPAEPTLELVADLPGVPEEPILGSFEQHINVGGSQYVASNGTVFEADPGIDGGSYITRNRSNEVRGTDDDALFQSYGLGNFSYDIEVPNSGTYEVVLYLTEPWFGTEGKRIFDVALEGVVRGDTFDDIDPYVLSGGKWQPLVLREIVEVTDGVLNIDVTPHADHGIVSGISVLELL